MEAEVETAFQEWLDQGPSPPTNGDIVVADKIDVELLHHLASFMFRKGAEHASMSYRAAVEGQIT